MVESFVLWGDAGVNGVVSSVGGCSVIGLRWGTCSGLRFEVNGDDGVLFRVFRFGRVF